MAAIHYLNPAPLMWSFEHEPYRTELCARYDIESATPAECAARLIHGTADVGLAPVAAYAAKPDLAVIPGCAIASLECVRSILLVVRPPDGIAGVRTVALDTSSRTSAAYARILFDRYWQQPAEFVEHAPDLDAMLARCDAALLIGDPALLAREDRDRRQQATGEQLLYLDLAQEWRRFTGTAWVAAFWMVRPDALERTGLQPEQMVEDFQRSRDQGMAHVEDLVAEWQTRIALPAETIRTYLTRNIHYVLDKDCLAGLELFYRYGAECGALPTTPKLRFL